MHVATGAGEVRHDGPEGTIPDEDFPEFAQATVSAESMLNWANRMLTRVDTVHRALLLVTTDLEALKADLQKNIVGGRPAGFGSEDDETIPDRVSAGQQGVVVQ